MAEHWLEETAGKGSVWRNEIGKSYIINTGNCNARKSEHL